MRFRFMKGSHDLPELNRRSFITAAGRGIFAASLTPTMLRLAAAAERAGGATPQPQSAAKGEPLPADRRVVFALMGLGRLTIGQLIPAFRVSKKAKLMALVSGDRAKAEKLARE